MAVAGRSLLSKSESHPIAPQFLTVAQVARLLNLTPQGVYARLSRGQFPSSVARKLGDTTWRFDLERLMEWVRGEGASAVRSRAPGRGHTNGRRKESG